VRGCGESGDSCQGGLGSGPAPKHSRACPPPANRGQQKKSTTLTDPLAIVSLCEVAVDPVDDVQPAVRSGWMDEWMRGWMGWMGAWMWRSAREQELSRQARFLNS